MGHPPPELERLRGRIAALKVDRRAQRRLSSACFFVAGIGFGTALYLLRARFATLGPPSQRLAFVGLLAVLIGAFWLGARAEAEVGRLEEELREVEATAASLVRR